MYAGLGSSLGVPQSALESVTSLDPKDYMYPSLGGRFSFGTSEQLASKGAQESMQVFSLESSPYLRGRVAGAIPVYAGFSSPFGEGMLRCVLHWSIAGGDGPGLSKSAALVVACR